MTVPARVLAVADSDSYLKWTAGLLDHLPPHWPRRLAVVRSPITPSPEQIRSALNGTDADVPDIVPARGVLHLIRRFRPDVVVLGCTGPVVNVLSRMIPAADRPVLVSGLPGISVPASERAWVFRSAVDLFVVHSRREVAEFTAIARDLGLPGRVGLTRLPFLAPAAPAGPRDRVVFATQAKVPAGPEERERILLSLAALAERRPDLRVVVKMRALAQEQQTHRERHHYQTLWQRMAGQGRVRPGALTFDAGPMRGHLAHAAGFVTVSSTAALEAIAAGVPLLVLSDFGVTAEMINLVFEDSGCLGTLDDLAEARFRDPDPAWCAANYFHEPADEDWLGHLTGLVETARAGRLPQPVYLHHQIGRLAAPRARLRLEVHPDTLRRIRTLRRTVRRR
ncbi:hypothetical protein SAMN04489712_12774 [Thermomonospora echinospora]|uniref:Uncharacterized protein n=1 Tax=Thermomonospora echinospora TaxID=1992 RepID=A0A1H6E1V7_9ACTN|nr:DUF6716 putative glycosyltransferase [Thermomonospora echinospora]SEG90905.1 hypothetical protein SAMN04489712_12774 [Thermomonospora echinospora]